MISVDATHSPTLVYHIFLLLGLSDQVLDLIGDKLEKQWDEWTAEGTEAPSDFDEETVSCSMSFWFLQFISFPQLPVSF